jgi:acetyltransferase-like isoleucine patch superfamily enzyme
MNGRRFAKRFIRSLDLKPESFVRATSSSSLRIIGDDSNAVYVREPMPKGKIIINFQKATDCSVFCGKNFRGTLTIIVTGSKSTIYVGDDCRLNGVRIQSKQRGDFIAVGDGVSTTDSNLWISGHGCRGSRPFLVIGDDCMFARDIVIRNSDAHPIYDYASERQINLPKAGIVIEPHVWIGERVNLLKDAYVGACSIIALGAIVTRKIPRFSIARGVPAVAHPNANAYWSRSGADWARAAAKKYQEFFRALELKESAAREMDERKLENPDSPTTKTP